MTAGVRPETSNLLELAVVDDVHSRVRLGAVLDRLEHDAIALDEIEQLIALVLWRVGVDIETQADFLEAHRYVLRDTETIPLAVKVKKADFASLL